MFDCVLPTRNGRNGQAFTARGKLNIKNARWAEDQRPLDESCRVFRVPAPLAGLSQASLSEPGKCWRAYC